MDVIVFLFLLCFALVFYTYIGYGVIVGVLAALKRMSGVGVHKADDAFEPEVALVIPCYNESELLPVKVKNSLELDYPGAKLDIVFITDGSTDGSEELLSRFKKVRVLHSPERKGKAAAENRAMMLTSAPFVIFCDANTLVNKMAVKKMMRHFADKNVGAVAGEKRVTAAVKNAASSAGEGLYWKYESWLKKQDSDFHTVAGGAGELIAFRRSCFEPLEEDTILDDFVASMRIALKGFKVVYEPDAYAEENASADVAEETKRKVRIAAGAWQALTRLPKALNPFHDFLLAFIFVSHKVFRWSVAPLALLFMIPSGYYLHITLGGFFTLLWIAQMLFYFLAMVGKIFEYRQFRLKVFFVPYYFAVTNWCMIAGFFRFIKGKQSVQWEKARRG